MAKLPLVMLNLFQHDEAPNTVTLNLFQGLLYIKYSFKIALDLRSLTIIFYFVLMVKLRASPFKNSASLFSKNLTDAEINSA